MAKCEEVHKFEDRKEDFRCAKCGQSYHSPIHKVKSNGK